MQLSEVRFVWVPRVRLLTAELERFPFSDTLHLVQSPKVTVKGVLMLRHRLAGCYSAAGG